MIQRVSSSVGSASEPAISEAKTARVQVDATLAGMRLDRALAQLLPEHSRARIQDWIEQGHVQVNDQVQTRVRQPVLPGDWLEVQMQPDAKSRAYEPEAIDFVVVDQTDHWLVVDKQAGLVVHPGAGNWQATLLNGLLARYPAAAHVARAGIVHRLDKDTSGLMVVAKTDTAQTHLVRQLQERTVKRQYRALVHGWLAKPTLTIDRPIGRDPKVPVRMSVSARGPSKPALTHVTCVRHARLDGLPVSEVCCELHTGRTHQIRVHMASIKHPLVGDVLYGGQLLGGASRQMLHAEQLVFIDPQTEAAVHFESALPADMVAIWQQLQDEPRRGEP